MPSRDDSACLCLIPALVGSLVGSLLTYCIMKSIAAAVEVNGEDSPSKRGSSSQQSFFHRVDGRRDNGTSVVMQTDPCDQKDVYTKNGPNVVVLSELDVVTEDTTVMMARKFDDLVVSKISKLEECKLLLHRTRAVSALVSRLMIAPDEDSCYEITTRLIVPLFRVHGCSYAMLTDPDHVRILSLATEIRHDIEKLGINIDAVMPLKGMMLGVVAETLEQQYCPRLKDSVFEQHQELHRNLGVNSILTTPIVGASNNFVGAIILYMAEENAFNEQDRILVQDIASMLGAILYAKRMRRAADNSHKISQKMLQSMIPSKVIAQIQVFWDENSEEFQSRRKSSRGSSFISRTSSCSGEDLDLDSIEKSSVRNEKNSEKVGPRSKSVAAKINFLNQINSDDVIENMEMIGLVIDSPSYDDVPLNGALYAENVKDVVIIFLDIVGFSKMSMERSPLEVMNMLEALFSRFDALCEKHNVEKLETIGDAYICTTNLFDDHHGGDVKRAALSALNMAKDMIYSAKDVRIPTKGKGNKRYSLESLQVRVGIHVGEVMCGVLGERLPKFTVLGHSVNVAARMEQTAEANKIRASEAFHDLVSDGDNDWDDYEVIDIKNMGSIGTFTMDPFKVKSWTMPSSKRQPARAGGVLSSSLDLLTSKSS